VTTLAVIRGLPGSGKSTLGRKLAQERGLVLEYGIQHMRERWED
jgi:adenylate kinase family enzyme